MFMFTQRAELTPNMFIIHFSSLFPTCLPCFVFQHLPRFIILVAVVQDNVAGNVDTISLLCIVISCWRDRVIEQSQQCIERGDGFCMPKVETT